jgi:hypothetical protein
MRCAIETRSSVVLPIADTTTTVWLPSRWVRATRSATRFMRSTSPTEVPPYFWTTMATARRVARLARVGVVRPGGRDEVGGRTS